MRVLVPFGGGNRGSDGIVLSLEQAPEGGQALKAILARLDEGFSFSVEGPAGANTIQAEPGRIRVSHADCPDQVCVHQGWISSAAVPIVCLPNRLVIEITTHSAQEDLDAVTGG